MKRKKQLKRIVAALMCLVILGSFLSVIPVSKAETVEPDYQELNLLMRTDISDEELVTADDLNIPVGSDYNPEDLNEGLHFDSRYVDVSFYPDASDLDAGSAGYYKTAYLCIPKSEKEPYLIIRHVRVYEKEKDPDEDEDGEAETNPLIGDDRQTDEFPLSEGEITTIQRSDATFGISLDKDNELKNGEPLDKKDEEMEKKGLAGLIDFIFPSKTAKAADTMKVEYSGYVSYCNHKIGYKFIASGEYKDCLAYCMDLKKNTTTGTITSGTKKIPAKITFCLVNGARKKGEQCHTSKYSSGDAKADYFITSAAIHVLNGEVKLSYYNNGSGVYKNIEQMVEDAKKIKKSDYNLSTGTTKSVTYTVDPTTSGWIDKGEGLYRSEHKFVRTKTGNVTKVTYKITGAPSGLTVGEIAKDSSDISDPDDLKKYDICVAQTNSDAASSNFYVYCNQDAMDKIIANKASIKVTATAYGDEKGGRVWKPAVANEQTVTFLEKITNTKSDSAVVRLKAGDVPKGSIIIKKTDSFDPQKTVNGATYALYEDPECEELLCELERYTGNASDGFYASGIEDLTEKKYYLKEIDCPEGYELDETVHEIDISYFTIKDASGNVIQEGRTFEVYDIPEPVSVMVIKKDSATGEYVKNAQFAVFDDSACTTRTKLDFTNPGKGDVPVFSFDEDFDAYVSEGFYSTQDTYYVKEISVPAGYYDAGTVYSINPDVGEMVTIDATNEAIKCEITAKKIDKEKGTAQGDAKLVGAVYGLYAKKDVKYPDGTKYLKGTDVTANKGTDLVTYDVDATAGTLLATIKTDENGEFGFKDLYYGSYFIKEITPSEGYLIDETEHDVDFTTKGSTSKTLEIEATSPETVMKQAFELIKVSTDGVTGETEKVKGAEFTVKLKSEIAKSSWEQATVYDTLTTDDKGYAKSIELPYGTYVVRETKTPTDLESVKDFEVVVDHDDRTPQVWRILNDAPFMAYIKLIKKDIETGMEVLLPDTTFKIKKAGETDFITQKLGDKYINEFKTDETGTVTTPLRLKFGDYEVTEIKAPDGYLLTDKPVIFKVTSTGAVKVDKDKDGDPVIDVTIENQPVKGKVIIKKTGEVLSGIKYDTIVDRIFDFFTGDQRSITFVYEQAPLSGAVFNLVADEDIYTADHQVDKDKNRILATFNGKPVKKGEVVATLTTDVNGEASIDNLPLGKYHLEEAETPKGYIPPETIEPIDLKFKDDHTAVIESESKIENIRQKTEVKVIKTEAEVYGPASGSAVDIDTGAASGGAVSTVTPTGTPMVTPTGTPTISPTATGTATALPTASATATGSATSTPAVSPIVSPTGSQSVAPTGTPTGTPEASEKPSNLIITILPQATTGSAVLLNEGSAGTPVEGATYGIYSTAEIKNFKGEVLIPANTLIEAEKTDANGEITFVADLPLGRYYVKEIEPAPGYLLDEAEYEVDFTDPDPKVALIKKELKTEDTPIVIQVSKADITTSHDIPDATLQILDHNKEVFAEWTSDGTPYTITSIPAGDYTLKEVATPYGYYITTEADFTVEATNLIRKVTMVDERAKGILEILKTDRETGDELAGVEFEILDQVGNVVEKITTDADGIARSSELDIGEYNPDGTFKEPYTYAVNEVKTADGYILEKATHFVKFEYDDNALEPIVTHLNITNQPTEPKLPQTGGNHTAWALIGAMAAGAGIGVYLYKRKKKIGGKKS